MKLYLVILKNLQISDTFEFSPQIVKYFQTLKKIIALKFHVFYFFISKFGWLLETFFLNRFQILRILKNCVIIPLFKINGFETSINILYLIFKHSAISIPLFYKKYLSLLKISEIL